MNSTRGIRKGDILMFNNNRVTRPEFRGRTVEVIEVYDEDLVECLISDRSHSWRESIHIRRLDHVAVAQFVGSDELDLMFSEISC